MMTFRRTALSALALATALTFTACEEGKGHGRIDPYSTTSTELRSGASVADLMQFCDSTAQQMVQDISKIDMIQSAPTRVVLELAPVANHTRSSTTDFEQIRARLRSQMINTSAITNKMMIVEQLGRMDAAFADTQRPGASTALPATYDPNITYLLSGDFYETDRDGRRQYYFEFKLINEGSRVIVWSHRFDSAVH